MSDRSPFGRDGHPNPPIAKRGVAGVEGVLVAIVNARAPGGDTPTEDGDGVELNRSINSSESALRRSHGHLVATRKPLGTKLDQLRRAFAKPTVEEVLTPIAFDDAAHGGRAHRQAHLCGAAIGKMGEQRWGQDDSRLLSAMLLLAEENIKAELGRSALEQLVLPPLNIAHDLHETGMPSSMATRKLA